MKNIIIFLLFSPFFTFAQGHFPIGGVNDTIDVSNLSVIGLAKYNNRLQGYGYSSVGAPLSNFREPYYWTITDTGQINADFGTGNRYLMRSEYFLRNGSEPSLSYRRGGILGNIYVYDTVNVGIATGLYGLFKHLGTGRVGHGIGSLNIAENNSTGQVDSLVAAYLQLSQTDPGGYVGDAMYVKFGRPAFTGSVGHIYALRWEALSLGASYTAYPAYFLANDYKIPSYMYGGLNIGDTAVNTATLLRVKGTSGTKDIVFENVRVNSLPTNVLSYDPTTGDVRSSTIQTIMPDIPVTRIPFGNASSRMTSDADLNYDATNDILQGGANIKTKVVSSGNSELSNGDIYMNQDAGNTSGFIKELSIRHGTNKRLSLGFRLSGGNSLYGYLNANVNGAANGNTGANLYFHNNNRIGINTNGTTPTGQLHIAASDGAAGNAPIKLASGTLLATPEVGAQEFLTDKYYATITTGAARKEYTLNDVALNSGIVPVTTTNGRLTNSTVTTTELGYVSGVTSSIQTQLNNKQPLGTVIRSSSSSGSITTGTRSYTFNGNTATWTLPTLASSVGYIFFIVNDGSGNITLNSNSGGNDIKQAGSPSVNTINILPGETYRILNDGTYFYLSN